MGWTLICQPLLCSRQIQNQQRHHSHSPKWDTVDVFPPIMPDLVLPYLYCCMSCHPTYLLSSLSSLSCIIPYLFCYPHHLESLSHICFFCLDSPTCHPYPPRLSSSAYNSAVLINLLLPCPSHAPPSPLSRISASAILIVLHIFRVYDVAVSIVPHLFHCRVPFLRCSYALTSSRPPVTPACLNQGSQALCYCWSGVCIPIGGTSSL